MMDTPIINAVLKIHIILSDVGSIILPVKVFCGSKITYGQYTCTGGYIDTLICVF